MKQVDEFVKAAGGRRVVADTCGVTVEAVRVWTVNNEINRTYLPTLEKLARDRKCFAKFKRAATARGDYLAGETA